MQVMLSAWARLYESKEPIPIWTDCRSTIVARDDPEEMAQERIASHQRSLLSLDRLFDLDARFGRSIRRCVGVESPRKVGRPG